jgi:leader peptidase (prepilin peptidase)/N-methyltransferase
MAAVIGVLAALSLVWGALWGSFLNVVAYRLPAGLSVVKPRSRCPHCGWQIPGWQNIPVVSWLLLQGQCHNCKAPISPRYPAVEATVALLAMAVAWPWLPALLPTIDPQLAQELATPADWRVWAVVLTEHAYVFALVAIALIDADTFLIPDVLSLPLPLLGIGLAVLAGDLRGVSWGEAAAGAVLGGGLLLFVQWGYAALTGREGMGTGDVKLLAGLGAFAGAAALPMLLLLAAVQGLLFAGLYAASQRGAAVTDRGLASIRHLALPFGPFLVLAGVQWLLLHRALMPWLQHVWLG